MATPLHPTLERYFAATNRHDVDDMVADFADHALVKDEGREHRGPPAIRAWMEETIRKYNFKTEPTSAVPENGKIAVRVIVSGNFPGSPITLTYRFKLEGDKIARLGIG